MRGTNVYQYLDYEECSEAYNEEILRKIVPYDETLVYVDEIKAVLKKVFSSPTSVVQEHQQETEDSVQIVSPKKIYVRQDLQEEKGPNESYFAELSSVANGAEIDLTTQDEQMDSVDHPSSGHVNLATLTHDNALLDNEDPENIDEEADNHEIEDPLSIEENNLNAFNSSQHNVKDTVQKHVADNNELLEIEDTENFEESNLTAFNSLIMLELQRNEALVSMYNERFKKISSELDIRYNEFIEHPEKISSFSQEWKKCYTEKSFQFASRGDYNYLHAWEAYIEELKNQELLERSNVLKDQLNVDSSLVTKKRLKSEFADFSDISDEDFEAPKRLKLDSLVIPPGSPPKFTELDRMIIAYNLAVEHLEAGQRLNPMELIELVRAYCDSQNIVSEAQLLSLTDNDLLTIHKNFNVLTKKEQENFTLFMKNMKIYQPLRYKQVEEAIKMQD